MTTQNERSTKEIITPGGHKIVLYDYITGGEFRKVQEVFMQNITASDLVGKDGGVGKIPLNLVFKAQEVALKFLIVSVNGGAKETAYQDAMDLKSDDLEFILNDIDTYTTTKNTIVKKNEESSLNTSQQEDH